jgi:hypothetical protein
MLTVTLPGKASLLAAARKLGIAARHFDAGYGVVVLDPDRSLYAVRVKRDVAGNAPFSDLKIRPLD